MSNLSENLSYILSPTAIRERCQKIYQGALDGKTHFSVDESQLEPVRDFVIDVINDNYPTLEIPFHSRWGHFQVGQIDRLKTFNEKIAGLDPLEQARTKIDLVITSVLLDAGAGATWKYAEKQTEKSFNRSEGLAVASFYMFLDGSFSSDKSLKADAQGLMNLKESDIISGFQVSDSNPLVGTAGRTQLLNSLGKVLNNKKDFFKDGRPGNIIDYLIEKKGKSIQGLDVLQAVLLGLGEIWPGRITFEDVNLGDVWSHELLGEKGSFESFVPFHKLSQWLSYSLMEPIMDAGVEVQGVEKLTGLAEYRNGGLFVDKKLINLRDPELINQKHKPSSDLIVEWRALTIILLDKIGEMVQNKLGKTPQEFPLAKVLEGGTWWAGRRIAAELREDNSTPIKLDSDGTVF